LVIVFVCGPPTPAAVRVGAVIPRGKGCAWATETPSHGHHERCYVARQINKQAINQNLVISFLSFCRIGIPLHSLLFVWVTFVSFCENDLCKPFNANKCDV
jgi:hypothetical protein